MNWLKYKEDLEAGRSVQFRPKGNSMQPKIESGNLVTVSPIKSEPLKKNDIVFCKVNGNFYVHLVQSVKESSSGFRYQIGNNKKHTNGTVGINAIYGIVEKVEK